MRRIKEEIRRKSDEGAPMCVYCTVHFCIDTYYIVQYFYARNTVLLVKSVTRLTQCDAVSPTRCNNTPGIDAELGAGASSPRVAT